MRDNLSGWMKVLMMGRKRVERGQGHARIGYQVWGL